MNECNKLTSCPLRRCFPLRRSFPLRRCFPLRRSFPLHSSFPLLLISHLILLLGFLEYEKVKIACKNGKSGDLPTELLSGGGGDLTHPDPPVGNGL